MDILHLFIFIKLSCEKSVNITCLIVFFSLVLTCIIQNQVFKLTMCPLFNLHRAVFPVFYHYKLNLKPLEHLTHYLNIPR